MRPKFLPSSANPVEYGKPPAADGAKPKAEAPAAG